MINFIRKLLLIVNNVQWVTNVLMLLIILVMYAPKDTSALSVPIQANTLVQLAHTEDIEKD